MSEITEREWKLIHIVARSQNALSKLSSNKQREIQEMCPDLMVELNKISPALKLYSADTRKQITTAVNKSGINKRELKSE